LTVLVWALLTALLVAWGFSRIVVMQIERRWPPIGQFLQLDAVRLHYIDMPARPDAPVLVLLHGASGNLREPIEALKEALGDRYRIVAFDRPGHGHSSRGPREMSDPARQAVLLADALDRLGVTSCTVAGHSWGASVAAAMAVQQPGLVDGLVLIAPATHPWPGRISQRTLLFALPYVGRLLAEFVVIPLGLPVVAPTVRAIFRPAPVPVDYSRRIGAPLAVRPRTFSANCRDIADFYGHLVRLSARYHEIRCPAEILTGDTDAVVAPAIHAFGLARDIPEARLTVLPGGGHMPHWRYAGEVAAAAARIAAATQDRRLAAE
jgi:pimeloyl-ACP methyl ester carboxylesterase